jgi:Na+-transporting methylmalonyl-CoA/oxaloacetate decarboxylase gamma subunit
MAELIQNLMNGTKMQHGIFVTIFGMAGVFVVLIIFFFLIRLLTKIFPYKQEE